MAKLAFTQNCHCLVRIFNLTDFFFCATGCRVHCGSSVITIILIYGFSLLVLSAKEDISLCYGQGCLY